jgi:hypothetical protein
MSDRFFQMVFYSALALTIMSGSGAMWLANTNDTMSAPKQQLFNILLAVCMLGASAIIGLISSAAGRSKPPERPSTEDTAD